MTSSKLQNTIGVAVVLAVSFGVVAGAWSQSETGALVLQFPLTARSEAMGGGGVADMADPGNIFLNAAAVNAVDGVYGHGAYKLLNPQFGSDIWFGRGSAGVGRALGGEKQFRAAFDFTFARLSYGEAIATDPMGNVLGKFEPKEDYFSLTTGASVKLSHDVNVALGVGYKRYMMDFGPPAFSSVDTIDTSPSANIFDVGVVASKVMLASDWRVTPALGLALVNLGPDIEFNPNLKDPLPSWFNYGVSVRVDAPWVQLGSRGVPAVSATVNFDGSAGLNEQRPQWHIGSEVVALKVLYVRWGRQIDDRYHDYTDTWGAALGLPIGRALLTLDYASVFGLSVNSLGAQATDTFGMSFVWNWNKNKTEGM